MWGRGAFTGRGRCAVFGTSTPRDHEAERGRLIRRLGSASPPRGSHALGVADGGSGKLGRREQRQRVGPDSLLFPCLDSLSGAAEPPPRSFIKSGRGAQKPALSHLLLSSASAPLSLIRHGEREPRPFIGGGEGRRQTAHLSLFRARGGRASHKGKREGARSRTRSRTRSRRSGKRRTGRRVSFTSAGGSSPHGGPYRGRPLRVLRQAAPGASSSPPASSSVCERDGVGPARDTETAHEGLWDQRHASPRCIPSP